MTLHLNKLKAFCLVKIGQVILAKKMVIWEVNNSNDKQFFSQKSSFGPYFDLGELKLV